MTVLDDLHGLESRVASRLQELRPLVEEYRALEEVAQRLGLDRAGGPAQKATPRSSTRGRKAASRSTRGSRRRTRRTASGGRQQQVVDAVKARPGITVREIGAQLGVDPTSLYRIVHRLEQDGTIKKQGRELHAA